MDANKHLLLVAHAPSNNARELADAVQSGATAPEIRGVEVRRKTPFETVPEDVLWAHGLILGTTENFGYMSGALKDFFDRIYYPCLDKVDGLPYGLFVRAGNDGTGALASIERIVSGLKWKLVQEPVICAGEFQPEFRQQCEELGMAMAAGLEAGIF
ncbi:MAG: flavodoxin family protein [Deltaproteobacteria bacterium]|nr:flavodoxin family protein [Deltaproteobacteria bacterium]